MNMRCLIVDDEKNAHYVLKNYIKRHPSLSLAGQCYSASAAAEFLDKESVDLIFLDINMPGQSGFDFIQGKQPSAGIILTTAHADFALRAYDLGVLDYLVKPVPYERFEQAIARFQSFPKISPDRGREVTFKMNYKDFSFNPKEIIYIQSYGNYIKLHTVKGEFICNSTTVEALKKLPHDTFVRIHKSYIVAVEHIDHFNNEYVILKSNEFLPIGITYRRVLEAFRGIRNV